MQRKAKELGQLFYPFMESQNIFTNKDCILLKNKLSCKPSILHIRKKRTGAICFPAELEAFCHHPAINMLTQGRS